MNNIAVILAGGIGKRMGTDIPKQFIRIKGIPVIILTIQRILSVEEFDKLIIAIHPDWKEYLKEILIEYKLIDTRIILVDGGKERLDSINNVVSEIMANHYSSAEDVVVICDAVRPFVSQNMLKTSIEKSRLYGGCVCGLPAVDTMLYVENNIVASVPPRQNIFHGQAPDSFKILLLDKALKSLTDEEKKLITGTAQICVVKNIPVYVIEGDQKNIKITTPDDIKIAENILTMGESK